MSEKPEWFKMTEGDQKPSDSAPKPKKHLFKVAAITAPLLIVGAVVFGSTGEAKEEGKLPAIGTSSASASASASIASSTTTTIPAAVTNPQNSNVGITNPAATSVGKTGVGVPMPSGKGGDDDGEGRHEREGHEKRESHESGEHAFGDYD